MALLGGRIASLDEGTSDAEREGKGEHLLRYFGAVCDVGFILRPNLVAHPHTLIQNFCGIEILRQTDDDSASVADQVPASLPFPPLPARFGLVDLEVGGDGINYVQEKTDFWCPPIRSPDEARLDGLDSAWFCICLVGRHTAWPEGNDQPLEFIQVVDRFDGLDTEMVEL